MKLLLTSAGITNKTIADALVKLLGKKIEDSKIVFIPTAANVEIGDKGWFIDNLTQLRNLNFKEIEIADISAVSESMWRPKIEGADVLFFSGGMTSYLMEWLNKSGLTRLLPDLLKDKVYVGVSAGSIVTNPDLALKISQIIYGEDLDQTTDIPGLNFVDFYFLPHLDSVHFPDLRKENIEHYAMNTQMKRKIYALDDASALTVVDGKVEMVSEGKYVEIN